MVQVFTMILHDSDTYHSVELYDHRRSASVFVVTMVILYARAHVVSFPDHGHRSGSETCARARESASLLVDARLAKSLPVVDKAPHSAAYS